MKYLVFLISLVAVTAQAQEQFVIHHEIGGQPADSALHNVLFDQLGGYRTYEGSDTIDVVTTEVWNLTEGRFQDLDLATVFEEDSTEAPQDSLVFGRITANTLLRHEMVREGRVGNSPLYFVWSVRILPNGAKLRQRLPNVVGRPEDFLRGRSGRRSVEAGNERK